MEGEAARSTYRAHVTPRKMMFWFEVQSKFFLFCFLGFFAVRSSSPFTSNSIHVPFIVQFQPLCLLSPAGQSCLLMLFFPILACSRTKRSEIQAYSLLNGAMTLQTHVPSSSWSWCPCRWTFLGKSLEMWQNV